jgi:hypothetical protein
MIKTTLILIYYIFKTKHHRRFPSRHPMLEKFNKNHHTPPSLDLLEVPPISPELFSKRSINVGIYQAPAPVFWSFAHNLNSECLNLEYNLQKVQIPISFAQSFCHFPLPDI